MKKIIKIIYDWGISLAISFLIFFIISSFISLGHVSGESMMPTYEDKDWIVVSKMFYDLEKGDVVTFFADADETHDANIFQKIYYHEEDLEEKELHIKRVAGLPGDKINIKETINPKNDMLEVEVYVNGELETVSSQFQDKNGEKLIEPTTYVLKEDEYFVLGDNTNNSVDSRMHGPVKAKEIFGEVINERDQVK